MADLPITFDVKLALSGERFRVRYRLAGDEREARAKAEDICVEQTIEFPASLVTRGDIRDHILGRVESFDAAPGSTLVTISYAVETSGFELPQLLNVVFGNTSIKPGVRVERLELSPRLLSAFRGPRFGVSGIRRLLGAPERPLLATALKPMGLPAATLADIAYRFALGGIDLIKDDHGLANQSFTPFRERVERCAEAVARANRETGGRCLYLPNITGPFDAVLEHARFAKQAGAGGFLVSPGLVGLDTLRRLADDDSLALPIMSHPALQGGFVTAHESGMAHEVIFGQIARLAGADASIFPNYGGRFSFSREQCRAIAACCAEPMGNLPPILPAPGGGMDLARIPDMLETYGRDVVFLIGGALHQRGPDLTANARYFRELVERA
jgi:ribulose-bisphosphate carboxylase large chain